MFLNLSKANKISLLPNYLDIEYYKWNTSRNKGRYDFDFDKENALNAKCLYPSLFSDISMKLWLDAVCAGISQYHKSI